VRYSSGRHEHRTDDPDDTRMLDDVVRYIGQRVVAVVAETAEAARAAVVSIAVTRACACGLATTRSTSAPVAG
jgi:putative selenate reductase molybdopterin-binding subunit